MAKNLKSPGSSQHENELKYMKEPLLGDRLDSVSQTSGPGGGGGGGGGGTPLNLG